MTRLQGKTSIQVIPTHVSYFYVNEFARPYGPFGSTTFPATGWFLNTFSRVKVVAADAAKQPDENTIALVLCSGCEAVKIQQVNKSELLPSIYNILLLRQNYGEKNFNIQASTDLLPPPPYTTFGTTTYRVIKTDKQNQIRSIEITGQSTGSKVESPMGPQPYRATLTDFQGGKRIITDESVFQVGPRSTTGIQVTPGFFVYFYVLQSPIQYGPYGSMDIRPITGSFKVHNISSYTSAKVVKANDAHFPDTDTVAILSSVDLDKPPEITLIKALNTPHTAKTGNIANLILVKKGLFINVYSRHGTPTDTDITETRPSYPQTTFEINSSLVSFDAMALPIVKNVSEITFTITAQRALQPAPAPRPAPQPAPQPAPPQPPARPAPTGLAPSLTNTSITSPEAEKVKIEASIQNFDSPINKIHFRINGVHDPANDITLAVPDQTQRKVDNPIAGTSYTMYTATISKTLSVKAGTHAVSMTAIDSKGISSATTTNVVVAERQKLADSQTKPYFDQQPQISSPYKNTISVRAIVKNKQYRPTKVEFYVADVHLKEHDMQIPTDKITTNKLHTDIDLHTYQIRQTIYDYPIGTYTAHVRVYNEGGAWTDSSKQSVDVKVDPNSCTGDYEYWNETGLCRLKCKPGEVRVRGHPVDHVCVPNMESTSQNCPTDTLSPYSRCVVSTPRLKSVMLPGEPGYKHLKAIRYQNRLLVGAQNQNASAMFYKSTPLSWVAGKTVIVQVVMSDGTNRWLRIFDKYPAGVTVTLGSTQFDYLRTPGIEYSKTPIENEVRSTDVVHGLVYEEGKMFDDVEYTCLPKAYYKTTPSTQAMSAECVQMNECVPGYESAELVQNGLTSLSCQPRCRTGTRRYDKTSLECTPCENVGKFVYTKNRSGACVKTETCVPGFVNLFGTCFETCSMKGGDGKTVQVKLAPQQITALRLRSDDVSCASTGVCAAGYHNSGTDCVLGAAPAPRDPAEPDWRHWQRRRPAKIATLTFDSQKQTQDVFQLYTIIQLQHAGPFGLVVFPCSLDMAISDFYVVHLWNFMPPELSRSKFVDGSYTNTISSTSEICKQQMFQQFPSCAQEGYWNSSVLGTNKEFGKQGHNSRYIAFVPIYREAPVPRPITVPVLAVIKTKTGELFKVYHERRMYPMLKKINGTRFNADDMTYDFESNFETFTELKSGYIINLWCLHRADAIPEWYERNRNTESLMTTDGNGIYKKINGFGLVDMAAYVKSMQNKTINVYEEVLARHDHIRGSYRGPLPYAASVKFTSYKFMYASVEPFKLDNTTIAVQMGDIENLQLNEQHLNNTYGFHGGDPGSNTRDNTDEGGNYRTNRYFKCMAVAEGYEIEFTQYIWIHLEKKKYKIAIYLLTKGTGTPMRYTRQDGSEATFYYMSCRDLPFETSYIALLNRTIQSDNPNIFFTIRKRTSDSTTFERHKDNGISYSYWASGY